MRAFFRRHRGLHIWFLAVCGVLGLYFALRTVPGLMSWVSRQVVMPLERAVASVCYRASFSVAELLYAIAAGVVLLWMGATVRRLITDQGRRGRIVYRFALTAVCTVLTVYAGFSLLWGVNYYAESFQEQSGVYARESTPEELALIKALAQYPEEIHLAARDYDPSRINRYLVELAAAFHKFYNACRVGVDDEKLRAARLYLCCRVKDVMGIILTEFKITVPESM